MAGKDLASRLRERITIETQQTEDNGRGGRRGSWLAVATVWAEVIALRGDEALANGVQRGTQLWKVTVRARADVTPKHRLRWRGTLMDIRVAAPTQERDALVMTCESGVVMG